MRYVFIGFILVTSLAGMISAEEPGSVPAAVVLYDGVSYDDTLTQFHSDLSPTNRAKHLKSLIGFAIRNHHADDVARLLVEECRTISPIVIMGFRPDEKNFLRQLLSNLTAMIPPNGTATQADLYDFTNEECRYWRVIVVGLLRLAAPHRGIFQQAMKNPDYPATVRCLTRMTVEEADFQDEVAKQVSELLIKEPASASSASSTGMP